MIKIILKAIAKHNVKYLTVFSALFFILIVLGSFLTRVSASSNVHPLPIVAKNNIPVCSGPASVGRANCHARVVTDNSARPHAALSPTGYGPLQFHTAYNLPTNAPIGNPIIAIVGAYDDPNAYSDLTTYSNEFGIPVLPQCIGSIADSLVPCFKKIDQSGGTSYPTVNAGWALEISLDVQIAHAICQNCKILLVEANSSTYSDLMTALNQAVIQGANVISNSYGSSEFSGETSFDSYLNHPGIAITFSSGDSGYGSSYPAASPFVTSVGGTTLGINSDNTYNSESVWSGAGSGCSIYEPKPSFQKDSGCAKRTIADVSADADPSTGASVYDTVPYNGETGWFQVGGTSLAAPLIGAVYALAGVNAGVAENSVPYVNFASLHDITNGTNGSCSPLYLCTGLLGYDGPTGLGTPNGLAGFSTVNITPTPTPTPMTVTFNDTVGQNIVLNGQYPTGVIDWGTDKWWLSSPWNLFTTKSVTFNGGTIKTASFNFLTPKILVSLQTYNGGSADSAITISCSGNPTVNTTAVKSVITNINTNWTTNCSTVTISSSNGWNTNFDNLVIQESTPIPTPTATPTPLPISVTITNPKNGSTVPENTTITITTNTSANVTKVIFTVNGSLKCTDTSSPFSCRWYVPKGIGRTYTIKATASNGLGGSASNQVKVTSR